MIVVDDHALFRRGLIGLLFGTGSLLVFDRAGQLRLRLRDLPGCKQRLEQMARAAGLVLGHE